MGRLGRQRAWVEASLLANGVDEMHYHGKDLRKGRISETGRVYLLTTVTEMRRPLFEDWRVGRLVVKALRDSDALGLTDTLAWVVMPDHLHWLMGLEVPPLGALMQRVKSRSAIAINRHRGSHVRIWQRGYHDHALRKEEDLRAVARYIIGNPLRAGLVKRIGDYPLWDAVWV